MTLTRRIAHNTIIQIVGKLVTTIIGIVVVGIFTRHLGAAGYGQYTTIIAFLQFFAIVLDLGLYIILVKKMSEPGANVDELVNNAFTLRIVSAVIILGFAPLVVLLFPYPGIVKAGVALTSLSYLFISLSQVLAGVFQKALRMELVAIAELVGRTALLIGAILVASRSGSLFVVLGAVVAGSFFNFLLTFIFVQKFVRIRLRFQFDIWRTILKESWPIAISVVLNLMYFKIDTVILSLYHPESDVGIYGATYKVLEILVTFPAMFAGLLLPLLSSAYAKGDRERFRRVLQKGFDFLVMAGLPIIVGTQFIATQLMVTIADTSFTASGLVLKILIVATGIIFIGNLFGNTVVAINRQKPMIFGYLAVAIISVVGYLIFIPRFSYTGAAWMTVVSEVLITVIAYVMVRMTSRVRLRFATLGKVVLSTIGMTVVLFLMRDLHWALLACIGIVSYGAFLLLTKGVSKAMIKDIVRLS